MVTIPLANLFDHAPPGQITVMETVVGSPFSSGFHLIDRPRLGIGLDAFGINWTFTLVPAGVGRTVGQTIITFEQYLAQVSEIQTDIGATTFFKAFYNLDTDEGRLYFTEFPLTRCGLWVAPATQIALKWVLVL